MYEPVTRSEFEAIIRPEIRTIDAFIDEMLKQSGAINSNAARPNCRFIAVPIIRTCWRPTLSVAGLKMGDIPTGLNSSGVKIIAKRALHAAIARPIGGTLWAATTARLTLVDPRALTTSADLPARPSLRVKLCKGEALVSLL